MCWCEDECGFETSKFAYLQDLIINHLVQVCWKVNDSTLVTQSWEIAFAIWVTCKSEHFGDVMGSAMGSLAGVNGVKFSNFLFSDFFKKSIFKINCHISIHDPSI